ncbi:MAG: hypothetical protein HYV03_02480 [Deltaproteobacteria bacterium]|nr:hypothetical protein [Deltaproteobacteria bacterium]
MSVGEIIVLGIAILVVLASLFSLRTHLFSGKSLQQQTVNIYMLLTIVTIVIPLAQFSSYHLLWLFPVSILLGTLSLVFPFSLLSIPGHLFGRLCLIGVDQSKMGANIDRYQKISKRFAELHEAGVPQDQIKKQLTDEFGQKPRNKK